MIKPLSRLQIAWRVAQDIADGSVVNLGAGMPTMVSEYLPQGREALFHAENGVLGIGPKARKGEEDPDLINAGGQYVTLLPGGSYFHHADSFAMIRGGHIDIAVLGAYEVSEQGDLANWHLPDSNVTPAVGGAMDLAACAKKVFVMMEYCARDGAPKILKHCTLPLTARRCVHSIYTDLAVVDVTNAGLRVREMIMGMDLDALQSKTGAPIRLADNWQILTAPVLG
jgi:3-oxoadipate CoA-transferase beta subunit